MSKYGKNIKKIRSVRGLTQAQLAEMLEVSRGVISSYEEGRAEPKIETILKTAEVFHLSTDILLSSNVTVNQLSGFNLPDLLGNQEEKSVKLEELKLSSHLFPENICLFPSYQIKANHYLQANDIVFALPAQPVKEKLVVMKLASGYVIGKIKAIKEKHITLDDEQYSNEEISDVYEITGFYSPYSDKSSLENKLQELEKRIIELERRTESQ
ncbi:helix-turn-helix domain-containing protein [Pararhodonellum marinum]|uniref:helix-turn-helix domain-containing protein n=1 Tax=Pararhodonellum marinum TaxID=2755358 RepID=UPI00188E0E5E|nr:helix-turn-helix transcriptional regulator [Pararhodonellum marinum]